MTKAADASRRKSVILRILIVIYIDSKNTAAMTTINRAKLFFLETDDDFCGVKLIKIV
jgi:hypothetical protein